ncbi:MAG: Inositol-1-phosphate synthase, partial [uncultured Microvirga sp.]
EPQEAPGRPRRSRQLRLLLCPGPVLLRRRERQRARAGADEYRARRLPCRRHRDRLRLRRQRRQGRAGCRESRVRRAEQHAAFLGRAGVRHRGPARPDARRPRQIHPRRDRRIRGAGGRRDAGARALAHRRARVLPAGRIAAGDRVLRRTRARGRLRLRELHPGLHRLEPRLAQALRGARRADHRRRHQEPGRRHHRPPRAGEPVSRARRAPRPHLPAQFRRQHRLPEHARARAARIKKNLENPGRDEPARHPAVARKHPCRAVRFRAVADGPEMGLYPHGRHDLRQRPPECRAEARSVGLSELGRRRDRRGALRQARAGPRRRRRARRALELFHEVAARAVHRRSGARAHAALRRRRRGL